MNTYHEYAGSQHLQQQSATSDIQRFFQSLEWLYVTTRYPHEFRGALLYNLALSGLPVTAWGTYLMTQIATQPYQAVTAPAAKQTQAGTPQPAVQRAARVAQLRAYADVSGLPLHLPLVAPAFLTLFGYTQLEYLADLHQVVGLLPVPEAYFIPWPDVDMEFLQTLEYLDRQQSPLARKTVAIMGVTANWIEQLVQQGIQRMRNPTRREDGNHAQTEDEHV